MDLHGIREDYSKRQLSEEDCAADPLVQFEQWLNEAITAQVNEPTAVNVAAVGTDGRPNSRMVLLKEVNPERAVSGRTPVCRADVFLARAGTAGAR